MSIKAEMKTEQWERNKGKVPEIGKETRARKREEIRVSNLNKE